MRVWMASFLIWVSSIHQPGAFQTFGPAEAKQGVTVSGTVVNSLTGEPVRRAEVMLARVQSASNVGGGAGAAMTVRTGVVGPQAPGDLWQQPRGTVTGADGSFRFDNVEEGEYSIFVRREGMVSSGRGPGLSPSRIRVRSGAPVEGLRYALAPQGVISGRVLDEEGEPVQGAQVRALRRAVDQSGGASWMPAGPSAQTDDRGHFRMHSLLPGKYLVLAQGSPSGSSVTEGAARSVPAPTYYPDALTPEQATQIPVAAGQEIANLDLRIRRVAARRVSGRVVLEDGSPAQHFMVMPVSHRRPGLPGPWGGMRQGREPGSFVLYDLPPGSYDLVARPMDRSNSQPQPMGTARVEVGDSDVEGVEIRFQPPFTLSGQVRVEGAGEERINAPGNLQVTAVPVGVGMGFGQGRTRDDGAFEISLQLPGRYRLLVSGAAMQQLYVASIRTSGGADVSEAIDLSAGAPESVVITLRADAARIAAERQKAEKEGESCVQSQVALIPPGQNEPPRLVRTEPLDSEGRAVLFPLPPGEYRIICFCNSDWAALDDPETLAWIAEKAEKIRVQPGEHKNVTVKEVPLP
jgi:hypothetical protein